MPHGKPILLTIFLQVADYHEAKKSFRAHSQLPGLPAMVQKPRVQKPEPPRKDTLAVDMWLAWWGLSSHLAGMMCT